MTKTITLTEKITCSDSSTLRKREHAFFAFWFIKQHSIEMSKIDQKHQHAYLYNAAIMTTMTLEALLNELAEAYLPNPIFDELNKEQGLSERIKLFIKHLTGQKGSYHLINEGNRKTTISKIDIGNIFNTTTWNAVIKLIEIRNKIIHRKVENETTYISSHEKKHIPIKDKWKINIDEIEPNIIKTEEFIVELRNFFYQSIEDSNNERLTRRFDFLQKEKQ